MEVHREEVREIVESQTCDNSLIDEYRQVCFDFQVLENPMKTEECQNRLKILLFFFVIQIFYDLNKRLYNQNQLKNDFVKY